MNIKEHPRPSPIFLATSKADLTNTEYETRLQWVLPILESLDMGILKEFGVQGDPICFIKSIPANDVQLGRILSVGQFNEKLKALDTRNKVHLAGCIDILRNRLDFLPGSLSALREEADSLKTLLTPNIDPYRALANHLFSAMILQGFRVNSSLFQLLKQALLDHDLQALKKEIEKPQKDKRAVDLLKAHKHTHHTWRDYLDSLRPGSRTCEKWILMRVPGMEPNEPEAVYLERIFLHLPLVNVALCTYGHPPLTNLGNFIVRRKRETREVCEDNVQIAGEDDLTWGYDGEM